MTDINLKTLTPDTSLPTTGFLFGADSQASTNPSVYSTQTVATTLLGSTSLTGDTVATSLPVLNLAQTWNSSGTTFKGIVFNAAGTSNANSATASLLMDLQVNGTTQFSVRKNGNIYTPGSNATFSNEYVTLTNSINGQIALNSQTTVGWAVGVPVIAGYTTIDTILTRKGAANLRFGDFDAASPVAQTLSVQSIVAGQTNASAAAYPFTITGAQGTGTGAGGSIIFQTAPAGGSGTAQNALAAALTIDATNRAITFAGKTFSSGSFSFVPGQTSSAVSGTYMGSNPGGNYKYWVADNTFYMGSAIIVGWASGANIVAENSPDTALSRAAAGVVQVGTTGSNASGTLKAAVIGTTTAYTVATLPTGFQGARAYVTDATLPTYLGTLTGGGSVVCPVFYNGTAWVSA